jgi:hypothetical protein
MKFNMLGLKLIPVVAALVLIVGCAPTTPLTKDDKALLESALKASTQAHDAADRAEKAMIKAEEAASDAISSARRAESAAEVADQSAQKAESIYEKATTVLK